MRTSSIGRLFLSTIAILVLLHRAAGEGLDGMVWHSDALTKVLRSDRPEV